MLKDGRIQMNIINSDQNYDNKVYISVAMHGGFAARDFWMGEDTPYRGSYAFYNLLSTYCKLCVPEKSFDFSVFPSATVISLCVDRSSYADELEKLLNTIITLPMDEELFSRAYAQMREKFIRVYKQESFRALHKALEFTEYNKNFLLREMIQDVDTISFAKFKECAERLLTPANMHITLLGNLGREVEEIDLKLEKEKMGVSCTLAAYARDVYMRQDCHTYSPGKRAKLFSALSVSVLGGYADITAKYFLMNMFRERIGREDATLIFDNEDMSLIAELSSIESLRDKLMGEYSEEAFEEDKKMLLAKCFKLMTDAPRGFCLEAAKVSLYGVDILHYMVGVENCSFENYKKLEAAADIMVTEAHIAIIQGGI